MPKFSKTIVTNLGLQTIQEAYASGGHFKFSEASTTTDDMTGLTVSDLKKITSLVNEPQVVPVESSYAANGKVNVNVAFDNKDLKEDYYLTALVLYIEDDAGNKVLYSITLPTEGQILISAGDGNSSAGLDITFNTVISDDGTPLIGISDVGMATHTDLKRLADDIAKQTDEKLAKLTSGGRNLIKNGNLMQQDSYWLPVTDSDATDNIAEIVDIDTLPGSPRAFHLQNRTNGRNGYQQTGISVISTSSNVYSDYVRGQAGTTFSMKVWGSEGKTLLQSITYTTPDYYWHRYPLVYTAGTNFSEVSVSIEIKDKGEIWATAFQHEVGTHMSDYHASDIDRHDVGGKNYWDEETAEVGFFDKDGSINVSKAGAQYDLHTPLIDVPRLYGFVTLSTFDGYDTYDHITLAFFDKDGNIIGTPHGTDDPLKFHGEPTKMSVTVPIPIKAVKFGVSFWKVTGKKVMIEFGDTAHDYVPSVERIDKDVDKKQDLIVQPGTYAYATCPDGTDFGDFLKSDAVPTGFHYIRNNNKGYIYNYAVLKENKSWAFAQAVTGSGSKSIYVISNGTSSGYLSNVPDENNFSGIATTAGNFKVRVFRSDNVSINKKLIEQINLKHGSFAFYCEASVEDTPAWGQSMRGLALTTNDGIGIVIAIDNIGNLYHGFYLNGQNTISWRSLYDHTMEGKDFAHRLYISNGENIGAKLLAEVSKGKGSFSFWCSTGAADNPFRFSDKGGFRGVVFADATKNGAEILAISQNGHMQSGVLMPDATIRWHSQNSDGGSIPYVGNLGITDLNDIKTTSRVSIGGDVLKNSPVTGSDGTWTFMDTYQASSMMSMQTFYVNGHNGQKQGADGTAGVYVRHYTGNPPTWSAWRFIRYDS
jgi:hypothetical protein